MSVETGCACYKDCFTCPFPDCIIDVSEKEQQQYMCKYLGLPEQPTGIDSRKSTIVELAAMGLNSTQIAARMNLSSWVVCYELRQMGIGRKHKNLQLQLL